MNSKQLKNFEDFYKKNKTGILTEDKLNEGCENESNFFGHSVLLIEVTKKYLRFLNSYGANWADGGTFKVINGNILKPYNSNNNPHYYGIFFSEKDLTEEEKEYYAKNNEILRKLINIYGEMSIKSIRNHINYLNYRRDKCNICNKTVFSLELKSYISEGLYYVKCPLCKNSRIAEDKIRELLLFKNLMHDGNEDFDINFIEKYQIDIKRIELHKEFEKTITNKSDRCTIGYENHLSKSVDSHFIKEVSNIICLENGKFVASASDSIVVFELVEKRINYLIMRYILGDNILTLCDLKFSNLIATGGDNLKIFQINNEKHELNLHLEYNQNKKINRIILADKGGQDIVQRFAACDQNGYVGFYQIKKYENNIDFSFVFNKLCHDSEINCILYLRYEKILVTGSNGDKKLKFWNIQNNDLQLKEPVYDIPSRIYNDSLLNINSYLLVGESDGIRAYLHEHGAISFSFFYKNEEFGGIYSIKYLGHNYFICGRSFGFCSIFLLREDGKYIRKVNIFRNNNLRTSDEEFNVSNDEFYISNICVKRKSETNGNILVCSKDKTLKAYNFTFSSIVNTD